jgi:prophage DNA circulation protein
MIRERHECKLDRFTLDVETLDERREKVLVRHEFPGRDGADLEDQGMRALELSLRVHFLNVAVDKVEEFTQWVRQNRENELVHPKYGTIRGRVASTAVRWTDADDAEVDLTFVEQYHEEAAKAMPNVLVQGEYEFGQGQQQLKDQCAKDLQSDLGADGLTVLAKTLVEGQSVLSQVMGTIGWAARHAVARLDATLNVLSATLDTVANPADSIISTIEWGTNLPGRILGTVARTVERYAVAAATVADAPSRFVDSMRTGLDALEVSAEPLSKYIAAAGALHTGMVVARMYDTDEQARDKLRAMEQAPAFDAAGRLVRKESAPAILSATELEISLAASMALIDDAVSENRSVQALKGMAEQLVDHVSRVKLERQRIRQVTIRQCQPLHLICHNLGLGYEAAERVLAINPQIKNPNFVEGLLNVYA